MKLFPAKPTRNNNDDNVIPLINIVFLMLIFFMLAGQITSTDALQVMPPSSETQAPTVPLELELLMDAEGTLAFNNQRITSEELRDTLSQLHESHNEIQLALKIDGEATAARLKPLLQLLTETGMKQVTLYTRQTSTAS
ncbi:MAG: ExbD/TolR family protein [Nitrincola lacisaponensis]|uniref:Biopolymer transport protein ExbD/TolR n=1 Tax=Nitrincola lacisaponensis TaxID=267850 RepID=A0A063Y2U9_9GAMM|nr:biopolymer transporter ExbD [Nitrincola lacisaponensis]KDE39989.1 Biopolymer transport protein ExbD/TolR [Nitrincola lacisaponensis]